MSNLPNKVASRIRKEVTDRYKGKANAEQRTEAGVLQGDREAMIAEDYISEADALWKLALRCREAYEKEQPAIDVSKDVNYIRALEYIKKRDPSKAPRER